MPKPYRRAICWVRRDLRLRDHAALAFATQRAEQVAVVFVFDRVILDALEDRDDRRVSFIRVSLEEMDRKLQAIGSRLVVVQGDPLHEIPRLAEALDADAVFAARDYEPYARTRDAAVEKILAAGGRAFETTKDSVIFEAGELGANPHRIYGRQWRQRLVLECDAAYYQADRTAMWPAAELPVPVWDTGFEPVDCAVRPGEDAGRERLRAFATRMGRYREDRHEPALEATSGLSAHLRFGTVSVRECVRAALAQPSAGAEKWLSELIWRDYYQDVLSRHPRMVEEPLRPRAKPYAGRETHAEAWREGRTGFPLVDAAMRCLRATGTMHNRLRMVVGSFYANDLDLDYRDGEAWFARYLLDFDLASNNGGWQWCAGTDLDASPYPRVMNPTVQSERYDPDGVTIRRWVPELRGLFGPAIHEPARAAPMELETSGIVLGETYPWPIVDHAEARRRLGSVGKAPR